MIKQIIWYFRNSTIDNNNIPIIYNDKENIKIKIISGNIDNQIDNNNNNNDNENNDNNINNDIIGPGIAKSNIDILFDNKGKIYISNT